MEVLGFSESEDRSEIEYHILPIFFGPQDCICCDGVQPPVQSKYAAFAGVNKRLEPQITYAHVREHSLHVTNTLLLRMPAIDVTWVM
jgi:hypothetical protein